MKKFSALLLLLVYCATSFGMVLHLHYCCGKLDNVSLIAKDGNDCNYQKNMHSQKCCGDKAFELKVKADQEVVSQKIQVFANGVVQILPVTSSQIFTEIISRNSAYMSSPPSIFRTRLYIQYCNYRI